MARVLFLRSNPVDPDPRVEKEALTLKRSGHVVRVLGWDRTAGLPRLEEKAFGILERLSIPANFGSGLANLPHLLRFQVGLLSYLWRNRYNYDVVHACDFDTLIPALIAKLLWRKKVVYDIFDFYADMLLKVPPWLKAIIRRIDLWAMGFADAVILADENRSAQIAGARPRRLAFIYNSPDISGSFPEIPPPVPPLRIGYVGLLSKERGLLTMLEVLARNPDWFLELAGFGGDEKEILAKAASLKNIRFYGRVPYQRGLEIAASSHVLFATYDPSVPNHRFSSANKLFEAMALGRPIIVARGTSMDVLVERYGLGFVVDYGDIEQIERALYAVANWDQERWRSFSTRVRRVFEEEFTWQIQARRLVALYRELGVA